MQSVIIETKGSEITVGEGFKIVKLGEFQHLDMEIHAVVPALTNMESVRDVKKAADTILANEDWMGDYPKYGSTMLRLAAEAMLSTKLGSALVWGSFLGTLE